MIIVTTDNVPGKEIIELKGFVKGSTVRCKTYRKRYRCRELMLLLALD